MPTVGAFFLGWTRVSRVLEDWDGGGVTGREEGSKVSEVSKSLVCLYTPITAAHQRQGQEDHKLEALLGCTLRLCLKRKKSKQIKSKQLDRKRLGLSTQTCCHPIQANPSTHPGSS